jgi:GT2 family glycosyltransferase
LARKLERAGTILDPMTGEPLITVAICTRNRAASLDRAVRSVMPQLDAQTHLVIVDNGSTDNTADVIATLRSECASIRSVREERPGISVARNRALAEAPGRFVLFLDDDEMASANWLASYRKFLMSPDATRAGCVGGPTVPHHEVPQPDWIEADYGFFNLFLGRQIAPTGKNPGAGNCAYARRTALALGGFAEDLARHEDSELSERLRRNGHEVWWLPDAQVRHMIPAGRFAWSVQWRLAWADGRATPPLRLREISSPSARRLWLLKRFALGIPQVACQVLLAGVAFLCGRRRNAARLMLRAARNAAMVAVSAGKFFARDVMG